MAAINLALGNEHGDEPNCVHPIIRAFDIRLNDSNWSSNEARALGMRREAIAKLGSTGIDGKSWLDYVVCEHIKRVVPIPLKVVASLLPASKEALLVAANNCAREGTTARAAAARAAAYATDADVPTSDQILTLSADIATEACIKFGTQGSKWLDILTEKK